MYDAPRMRTVVAILVLLTTLPAAAQLEVGARHNVGFYGETSFDGGRLELPMSRGFAATGEWFFRDALSAHVAATFLNPEAILYVPNDVDLGTLGIDIVSLQGRYHFRPNARISPVVGAGAALIVFGNLDDQFGDDVEASVESQVTFVAEAGARYRIGRIALELTATYMPVDAALNVQRTNVALPEAIELRAVIVNLGGAWRF